MLYQFEMIKTDENLPIRFIYSPTGQHGGILQHWHNTMEIFYLLSGSVDITVNKQVYHLKPGDILTINPNHIHSTNSDDLNTAAYILQIPFSHMQYCYPDIKTLEFDTYNNPSPEREGLRELFERFYETYQESSDLKGLRIKALVYETIYTLIKYFSAQKQNSGDMNEITLDRLTKITMYIDENYSMLMNTNRSIAYISDVCGFSTYRIFTNKFKKYYHTPLKEFRLLYKKTMDQLRKK